MRDLMREAEGEFGRGNLARAATWWSRPASTTWPRFADAERLATEAIGLRERKLGPEHAEVAAGLQLLANILHGAGRTYEAGPVLRRALAMWERSGTSAAR